MVVGIVKIVKPNIGPCHSFISWRFRNNRCWHTFFVRFHDLLFFFIEKKLRRFLSPIFFRRLRETPIFQDVSRNSEKICLIGCWLHPLFLTVPANPTKMSQLSTYAYDILTFYWFSFEKEYFFNLLQFTSCPRLSRLQSNQCRV